MRIAPEPRPVDSAEPALLPQLAHGEVLDDAVLHVLQAGVVRVQDRARLGDVEVVLGADVPRELGHPVEVGADPAVLGRLLGRALQAAELALGLLADVLGHVGVGDLLAVLLDDVLLAVLAELLADRVHLLAQEELALALLHALADVGADLVLQLELGQDLLGPGQDLLEALLDVEGLEDLDLLLERQVRRVAGRVGERAGVGDAAQELGDLRARRAPRRCSRARPGTRARARGRARSVSGSGRGSTCTHVASPVPATPVPTTARCRPRITRASRPLRSRPTSSTLATVPILA